MPAKTKRETTVEREAKKLETANASRREIWASVQSTLDAVINKVTFLNSQIHTLKSADALCKIAHDSSEGKPYAALLTESNPVKNDIKAGLGLIAVATEFFQELEGSLPKPNQSNHFARKALDEIQGFSGIDHNEFQKLLDIINRKEKTGNAFTDLTNTIKKIWEIIRLPALKFSFRPYTLSLDHNPLQDLSVDEIALIKLFYREIDDLYSKVLNNRHVFYLVLENSAVDNQIINVCERLVKKQVVDPFNENVESLNQCFGRLDPSKQEQVNALIQVYDQTDLQNSSTPGVLSDHAKALKEQAVRILAESQRTSADEQNLSQRGTVAAPNTDDAGLSDPRDPSEQASDVEIGVLDVSVASSNSSEVSASPRSPEIQRSVDAPVVPMPPVTRVENAQAPAQPIAVADVRPAPEQSGIKRFFSALWKAITWPFRKLYRLFHGPSMEELEATIAASAGGQDHPVEVSPTERLDVSPVDPSPESTARNEEKEAPVPALATEPAVEQQEIPAQQKVLTSEIFEEDEQQNEPFTQINQAPVQQAEPVLKLGQELGDDLESHSESNSQHSDVESEAPPSRSPSPTFFGKIEEGAEALKVGVEDVIDDVIEDLHGGIQTFTETISEVSDAVGGTVDAVSRAAQENVVRAADRAADVLSGVFTLGTFFGIGSSSHEAPRPESESRPQ